MNIAYLIWLEDLYSPILKGQVIELLKDLKKISPQNKYFLFAFQPIYTIILYYHKLQNIDKDLKNNDVNLIIIPTLIFPRRTWFFSAKWYIVPLIFLYSFPILLFLNFVKKIDILHCRSYPIMSSAIMVKKIKKNLKVVFDPRSPFPEENITAGRWAKNSFSYKLWKILEKQYLEESNAVIAIANTYVKHFERVTLNSNFIIIPNNVDTKKFMPNKKLREYFRKKMGMRDDEIIFVYSGSLGNHWNNPKIYAKIIIKLRKLNMKHRFLFLTSGVKELKKIFNQYNVYPNEYFAIYVDFDNIPKYLSIADFGLNLMEKQDIRMSIKTCEYLAMGLPIIVNSNVLGAKEIIKKYDVGLVLEDLENINLREIENIIQKRDQISLKCRKVAFYNFSTTEVAKQYLKTYKNLKGGNCIFR